MQEWKLGIGVDFLCDEKNSAPMIAEEGKR